MPVPVPFLAHLYAMAYRRYKRKRRYTKRRGSRKYPRRSNNNSSKRGIVRLIKSNILRNTETKYAQASVESAQIDDTILDTDVHSLIPGISQGTGEHHRIGNKINPVSLTLTLSLTCYNQAASVPPIYFDIYIFKFKAAQPNFSQPTVLDMQSFLELNNLSTQYTGDVLDGLRPLNNDLFTQVMHKRVTLFNPLNNTTQLSSTSQYNPNRYYKIRLGKFLKNTLIFNDNNILPTNDNLYIAIGATQTSGGTAAVNYGQYTYLVDMAYKDA